MIRLCAWCKTVLGHIPSGCPNDKAEFCEKHSLRHDSDITHGICDPCLEKLRLEAKELKRKASE